MGRSKAGTENAMRPALKHGLLLIFLVVSLAIMIAVALWQMGRAKEPRRLVQEESPAAAQDSGQNAASSAPALRPAGRTVEDTAGRAHRANTQP